jgi:hypothetical protein
MTPAWKSIQDDAHADNDDSCGRFDESLVIPYSHDIYRGAPWAGGSAPAGPIMSR